MNLLWKASSLVSLLAVLILSFSFTAAEGSSASLIEGAKKEGALVFYTSMTASQAQTMLNAFKAKYQFIQPTIYRAVGERLLTKIMTETQAGRYDFDVVQSAETQAYFLKKKKLAGKYLSPETKYLQASLVDPDGYWAAVYVMPNVVAYNTSLVRRADVPKSYEEFLDPRWRGNIGMDPTKPEWFAWMIKQMGDEKGMAYMKKLAAQDLRLHPGLSLLTNLLAAGEFPLVLNDYLHTAEEVKRKGGPVDWIAYNPLFTKFQPIQIGARAPHPNTAKLFVDFVLSAEGQKIIASFGRLPTRRGVPTEIEGLDRFDLVINDPRWADEFDTYNQLFHKLFVRN